MINPVKSALQIACENLTGQGVHSNTEVGFFEKPSIHGSRIDGTVKEHPICTAGHIIFPVNLNVFLLHRFFKRLA